MGFLLYDGSVSTSYKVGDKFTVVDENQQSGFKDGSVVILQEDDGTSCPLFRLIGGGCVDSASDECLFEEWCFLTPYVDQSVLEKISEEMTDVDIVLVGGKYTVVLSRAANIKTIPMSRNEVIEFCKTLKENRDWMDGYLAKNDNEVDEGEF